MLPDPARLLASVLLLVALVGCSSTTVSEDPAMNYKWVFSSMPQPQPEIVNSRVERINRCCFLRPVNGDWEFEVYAARSWVDALRTDLEQIEWSEIQQRSVPAWFSPTPAEYTVWRMQRTSYPNAHIFVERRPRDESRIHVFVRRH